MTALATQLFREVRPDFFRVLAGPLARLYVDALDALEREASGAEGEEERLAHRSRSATSRCRATDGSPPLCGPAHASS